MIQFAENVILPMEENKKAYIERRVQNLATNVQKICAKYLLSAQARLPKNVDNFYLDKDRKLGWCVNAKVSQRTASILHLLYSKV